MKVISRLTQYSELYLAKSLVTPKQYICVFEHVTAAGIHAELADGLQSGPGVAHPGDQQTAQNLWPFLQWPFSCVHSTMTERQPIMPLDNSVRTPVDLTPSLGHSHAAAVQAAADRLQSSLQARFAREDARNRRRQGYADDPDQAADPEPEP